MNLTVKELKLTGLWARNHYLTGLDFKICLPTRKVSGPVFKPSLLVDMPTYSTTRTHILSRFLFGMLSRKKVRL